MMTLRQFAESSPVIPAAASWYLADVAQAVGKQELFTRQAPQKLKALREHALIESAVSSNRIEGVEVDPARVGTVVFGKASLRDRDEEEVRGYRRTLDLIHSHAATLPITEETIRQLHRVSSSGKNSCQDRCSCNHHLKIQSYRCRTYWRRTGVNTTSVRAEGLPVMREQFRNHLASAERPALKGGNHMRNHDRSKINLMEGEERRE